jgi:ABC-2 type transport system permease protein
MSSKGAAAGVPITVSLTRFRWPKSQIARFVARRNIRSAAFWALAFGAIVASKVAAYVSIYPTAQERLNLAASFSSNVGMSALFGTPRHLETVAGYAVWNGMAGPMMVGAMWAFLLSTKTLRGEEVSGRWELLLSGQTSARRATANALVGLAASVAVLYVVTAITFVATGMMRGANFSVQGSCFFALAAVCGAAMFMAVGALTSQLMATRSGAAGLAAAVFGVSYLLRAVGDTTSYTWLTDVSPLGWVEKLQPLFGSDPVWLFPIAGLTVAASLLAIYLAGKRDLGASIIADREQAKPHTLLLGSPLGAAFRLTRASTFSWVIVIAFMSWFFGYLTKSAEQAVTSSGTIAKGVSRLTQTTQTPGASLFLGVIFLMITTVAMCYVASAVGRIRQDEADGYLDNYLVRAVSRMGWLRGRIALVLTVIIVLSVLSGIGAWSGEASQQIGLSFHVMLMAGLNLIAPSVFVLGVAIASLAVVPRATTTVAFGAIVWSFLVQLLSSGISLSHWVLDTSVLHHVNLAPAVDPNWQSASVLAALGIALCIFGAFVFNTRDLASE